MIPRDELVITPFQLFSARVALKAPIDTNVPISDGVVCLVPTKSFVPL
jgi:hypothetical protein